MKKKREAKKTCTVNFSKLRMSVQTTIIPPEVISNVRDLLTSLAPIDINGTTIEVEARFGQFSGPEFTSGVSRGTFNRMKRTMSRLNPRFAYIHSKDEIFRDRYTPGQLGWPFDPNTTERFTTVYTAGGLIEQTFRLIKSRVRNFDIPDYFFRTAVAKETTDETPRPNLEPLIIREKKRWSYEISQGRFRVDLTEVTTYRPADRNPRRAKTVHEIEIEILGSKAENLSSFEETILIFLKEIQGTLILYTSQEKADIISKTNTYIGSSSRRYNSIDLDAIIQPRNLKVRDLSVGAIVPATNREIRYTVTIKADGKRKLLVIDRIGIYLIYSDEVMKIASAKIAQRLTNWHGTVFECEYISEPNLAPSADPKYRKALIYATIYDTLAVMGQPGVRNQDHLQRIEHAQRFLLTIQGLSTFIFEVKTFKQFSTVTQFYQMVNEVLFDNYPFNTDGLIFTPNNYRYDPAVNRMKLRQRILSKQPDIMKWKPPSQLTIDFAIRHSSSPEGNYIELLVSEGDRLIPFSGQPFDPKRDIQIIPELQNAPNNSVIEFRWTYEGVDAGEESVGKFTYVKPRDDKPYPNRGDVAEDVWKDIQSPIDEATITGQKFSLAFRYHNREKWTLFNIAGTALPPVDGVNEKFRVLLDIGSGRGGDVRKWTSNGFTHIICVEPNEANRLELANRLEGVRREQVLAGERQIVYRIVPTTGQDLQTIVQAVREFSPNGYVHAISYMLSLSFFFDSPQSTSTVLALVQSTLMHGGYFLALSIDGRYVLEYFNNPANSIVINGVNRSYMQLIDFQLRPPVSEVPLNHVFINIPNSIVQNQIEYLTNIPGLSQALQTQIQVPLVPVSEWRTDKETFLIPEEIQYTRLFTALAMKRT